MQNNFFKFTTFLQNNLTICYLVGLCKKKSIKTLKNTVLTPCSERKDEKIFSKRC